MTEPMPLPPPFQLSRMITSYWVPQSIYAAAALGIADALAGGPMQSRDVAREVDADPDALHRLMRALVALELCTVTDDGAFELTTLGACLRRDSKDSVRAWALLLGSEQHWHAWGRLVECIKTGRSVPALDGRDTWVEPSGDPAASDEFNQSMVQLTRHIAGAVAVSYDFSAFGTIADVGGGFGALLPPILKANPGVRGVVFDLPRCRDGARALAEKTRIADRCTFVGGDFFTDALPPADAYLVKSVIHDWDDERSLTLLRNIRKAMTPEARLLVVEPIVPARPGATPFDAMLAHTDLNMLVVTGGRERTETDFRTLIERAGLVVTRIVPTPATMSIIEARRS